MAATKIEWADLTINPIIGCAKCSPGCDNCYAERMAARLAKMPQTRERYSKVVTNGKWNGKIDIDLTFSCFAKLPVNPKRIFIGSMGDVYHDNVSQDVIDLLLSIVASFPLHTFLILTKRPERMRDMVINLGTRWLTNVLTPEAIAESSRDVPDWPLPNVWLGVTVCNQAEADEKIPILLATPAAKRFLSIEPMLGDINIKRWLNIAWQCSGCEGYFDGDHQMICPDCGRTGYWSGSHIFNGRGKSHNGLCRSQSGMGLDWVILGGENGPGARPMHPDWVRSVRDQCQAAGVPFFFKGWGEWAVVYDRYRDDPDWRNCPQTQGNNERYLNISGGHGFHGDRVVFVRRVGKKSSGSTIDGREWRERPE